MGIEVLVEGEGPEGRPVVVERWTRAAALREIAVAAWPPVRYFRPRKPCSFSRTATSPSIWPW